MIDPAVRQRSKRSKVLSLIVAMRPRQWIKNLLVLAAPATAGALTKPASALRAAEALGIFVAASAGTYLLNDTVDAAADRLHPRKRHRPIAAGEVSRGLAIATAMILLCGALSAAAFLTLQFFVVAAVYIATTLSYTFGMKRLPVIELGFVSAGFVLRASAGGAAGHIPISPWFLIVTSAGALFVVAGKRSAELTVLGDTGAEHRAALGSYPPVFLLACRMLAACVAATSYCLWVFERSGKITVGSHFHNLTWFEFSIIPFVFGLLMLELAIESGKGSEPEELALHDRGLQVMAICWLALIGLGIYA